jgi:hypothetical protein
MSEIFRALSANFTKFPFISGGMVALTGRESSVCSQEKKKVPGSTLSRPQKQEKPLLR